MEQPREVSLPSLNGGLNVRDPEYSVNDNQSPDMLNMWYRDSALTKRPGQTLYTTLSNVYKVSDSFGGYRCVHAGTNLYKWSDAGVATKITTSALENQVQNSGGLFIEFGSYMYYFDGVEIWRVSSTYTVTRISPYVPTVLINATPATGAGTDNEAYNLIGAGFEVWYNGDGVEDTYQLPQTALDSTEIIVEVDGATKTLTTDYSWDDETGVVTFVAAPSESTNNVRITAYKTVSGNKAKIAKCKYGTAYGGEASGVYGGTRVFAMGNADSPFTYWMCDLSTNGGMTYWPDTQEELLDMNSEDITGCQKMGEYLMIIKENSIFAVGYSFDGTDVFYPKTQVFDTTGNSVGCDMPGSVQLIDNKLVFAHSRGGVFIMTGYSAQNESMVKPLSGNINKLLLDESNLTSAVSVDYDQCYWLCANGYAYIWDYGSTPYYNMSDYDKAQRRLSWYRFDGISPTCIFGDTELYYGKSTGIVKFIANKNDFGQAYNAYWKSKAFDLGAPETLKTFQEIYPSFSSDGSILATVTVMSENTDDFKSAEYDIRNFDLGDFSLDHFTLDRIKHAISYRMKVKMKKCAFIQIKVSGNDLNRGVGLSGLRFTFVPVRKTKRRS